MNLLANAAARPQQLAINALISFPLPLIALTWFQLAFVLIRLWVCLRSSQF